MRANKIDVLRYIKQSVEEIKDNTGTMSALDLVLRRIDDALDSSVKIHVEDASEALQAACRLLYLRDKYRKEAIEHFRQEGEIE